MAAIKLDLQSCKSARDDPVMHLLPCEIEFDGEAKVDQFFGTGIREDQTSGKDLLTTSFRGRPLHGERMPVPEGYTGIIVKELHKPFSEEEDREFKITHKFKDFTCWNLDNPPSSHDKIHQAMDWIDIAKAVHDPIVEKVSPKSDSSR